MVLAPYPNAATSLDASPYPVEQPIIKALFGLGAEPFISLLASLLRKVFARAACKRTSSRQPSG